MIARNMAHTAALLEQAVDRHPLLVLRAARRILLSERSVASAFVHAEAWVRLGCRIFEATLVTMLDEGVSPSDNFRNYLTQDKFVLIARRLHNGGPSRARVAEAKAVFE